MIKYFFFRLYSRNVPQLTQMLLQEYPSLRQSEGMMRYGPTFQQNRSQSVSKNRTSEVTVLFWIFLFESPSTFCHLIDRCSFCIILPFDKINFCIITWAIGQYMWVWYHYDNLEIFITIVKCLYFYRSYMFLVEFLETVATETANMQKVCTDMTSGEALSQKSPFIPAIYWLEIHTNKWTHKTPMYLMDERVRLTTIGSPIFFLRSPLHVNLILMLVSFCNVCRFWLENLSSGALLPFLSWSVLRTSSSFSSYSPLSL